MMNQLPELLWAAGIFAILAIFGVADNDRSARPEPTAVCLDNKTVVILEDQWEECFRRYPGVTCGKCGTEGKCSKKSQDPTCVAVEGKLP